MLTAAFMLLVLWGCTAKFPAITAPEGWAEYRQGPLRLFCPTDKYFSVSPSDAVLELTNEEGTASIRIEKAQGVPKDITGLDENYLAELAEATAEYYDKLYEEAYGLPFDTSCRNLKSEIRTKGNGRCVCLSYDTETTATLVAITVTASCYQVVYTDGDDPYAVTFCIVSDNGISAQEYFGKIIGKLFIE